MTAPPLLSPPCLATASVPTVPRDRRAQPSAPPESSATLRDSRPPSALEIAGVWTRAGGRWHCDCDRILALYWSSISVLDTTARRGRRTRQLRCAGEPGIAFRRCPVSLHARSPSFSVRPPLLLPADPETTVPSVRVQKSPAPAALLETCRACQLPHALGSATAVTPGLQVS